MVYVFFGQILKFDGEKIQNKRILKYNLLQNKEKWVEIELKNEKNELDFANLD